MISSFGIFWFGLDATIVDLRVQSYPAEGGMEVKSRIVDDEVAHHNAWDTSRDASNKVNSM